MYSRRNVLGATVALHFGSLLASAPCRAQTKPMTSEVTPVHLSVNSAAPFSTQPWDVRSRLDLGAYSVERVAFEVDGVSVVGNLFLPSRRGRQPGIVVTGPVAYIKEQAPMQYASRLARQGYATLIYDPRYHGESAGLPRRFESRRAKVEDVRAAVAYLSQRAEVDRERIHAVGLCQGMNWAVEAAADDPNVRSVALVAGHYLVPETAALYLGNSENVARRIDAALQSRTAFEASGQVDYIPIVSLSDPNALLPARAIYDFYYHWADRGPFAAHRGLWENRITRMSEADIWGHRVDEELKRLHKPTLMVHSDRAASGPKVPRQLFDVIASKDKQAVWFEGRNQVQFYQDPLTIDMVIPHLDAHFQKFTG